MGKKPDARAEPARELYIQGMKLIDIANKLNVPPGTVRRWKSTYGWDDTENGKSERSEKKSERSEKEANVRKEVEQVIENDKLNDKQKLFCLYYVRCFNATKAYQRAYGVDYKTAASIGYRLLENDGVREEIKRLKQNRLNRQMLDEHDIFQRYMDIAFSDIKDYVKFRQEEVQVMGAFGPIFDQEKNPVIKKVNAIWFKDSDTVDGSLIAEVKQGKDGASIKLLDQMKALDWLTKHMGMATEEQKAKIALLKKQAESNSFNEDETGIVEIAPVLPDEEGGGVDT